MEYAVKHCPEADTIIIEVTCKICGTAHNIEVTTESYNKWLKGAFIQEAFSMLSSDDRELLVSGICGKCFDEIFQED